MFDLRSDETLSYEKEYRRLLGEYKIENYYYSSTYDLTNTLARNMTIASVPLYDLAPPSLGLHSSVYSGESEFMGIC